MLRLIATQLPEMFHCNQFKKLWHPLFLSGIHGTVISHWGLQLELDAHRWRKQRKTDSCHGLVLWLRGQHWKIFPRSGVHKRANQLLFPINLRPRLEHRTGSRFCIHHPCNRFNVCNPNNRASHWQLRCGSALPPFSTMPRKPSDIFFVLSFICCYVCRAYSIRPYCIILLITSISKPLPAKKRYSLPFLSYSFR